MLNGIVSAICSGGFLSISSISELFNGENKKRFVHKLATESFGVRSMTH